MWTDNRPPPSCAWSRGKLCPFHMCNQTVSVPSLQSYKTKKQKNNMHRSLKQGKTNRAGNCAASKCSILKCFIFLFFKKSKHPTSPQTNTFATTAATEGGRKKRRDTSKPESVLMLQTNLGELDSREMPTETSDPHQNHSARALL